MHNTIRLALPGLLVLSLAGCGDTATLPVTAGMGPHPTLPPPHRTLLPTINISPAKGWPPGAMPAAAAGLSVSAYANGLDHPRWLYVLPNGDVLVARDQRPAQARGPQGPAGMGHEAGHETGGRGRSER
jgi:glucose/arabinose dehydrogenase